jgi:hypothetical protein
MSNAAERLAALDALPAIELCRTASELLDALAAIMNEETTLLRAGHVRQASTLTAEKTRLAQDYMGLARAVQRQAKRLRLESPEAVDALRQRHERLTTQMAENLKVIATAREITEAVLSDVAEAVAADARPKTYGRPGGNAKGAVRPSGSIAIDRAL